MNGSRGVLKIFSEKDLYKIIDLKCNIPKSKRAFCWSELGFVLLIESSQDFGVFPLG